MYLFNYLIFYGKNSQLTIHHSYSQLTIDSSGHKNCLNIYKFMNAEEAQFPAIA